MSVLVGLWDIIGSGIGPYLAAGAAALIALAVAFFKGRAGANAQRDVKDVQSFKRAIERMQDADAAMGDDPAVLRDRLRQRDPDQR